MTNWLLRGLAFAATMVVLRLIQGVLINTWESHAGLIGAVLVIVFVIAVVVWGLFDGRDDASANPDPDRRRDLAMMWLVAALVAGVLGGVVAWFIALFDKALYTAGLLNEVTTVAAFTALVVFVPAMGGVTGGRWLVDRGYTKAPQRHHGLADQDEDRADTDVFAAVSVGAEPTADAATAAAAVGRETPAAGLPVEDFPVETEETTAAIPEPGTEPTEETAAIPTDDAPTDATEPDDQK